MDIEESGHTDVASAKNQVKVAMSALEKMRTELGKLGDEGSLPSWWTNKVAIAVDKLDGMADYLDTQVEEIEMEEENELDEAKPEYEVKYAKSKSGSIKVTKFMTLDQAKEFLVKVKKDGMNGTISKGGKSVRRIQWRPRRFDTEGVEIDEDAKMAKQSDDNLKSMMKKMRDAEKKDPKMPSTQFMIKRIGKEMKKRGLKEMNEDNELIQRVANAISFYEAKELDEKTKWKMGDGRPRGGSHIENERFWDLPKDSLEYIIKDAGDAMKANPKARKATSGRGNWADQVNDAQTVLGWRKKNGIKEESELDEVIPKSTMYGVVVKGKFIAKGSKANMRKLAKEKGGKLYNSPRAKVGDSVGKSEEVELDEAKYEYDGKVVKISKKEFAKVSKDYKNSTKGKERMMVLDPKTQGSISVPVQFEEVELDEAIPKPSKELQRANKLMGPSKNIEQGIQMVMKGMKVSEKEATRLANAAMDRNKKYGNKAFKEEVDESVQRAANAISHHEARKMSPSARARRDALRDIGKDKSKDDDEVKATDADREKADRNIINKLKKAADVKGNYEIKFDKGPSKKIPYKFIKFALDKHAKMKPADKLKFQKQAEKSYVDFLKAVKDMTK